MPADRYNMKKTSIIHGPGRSDPLSYSATPIISVHRLVGGAGRGMRLIDLIPRVRITRGYLRVRVRARKNVLQSCSTWSAFCSFLRCIHSSSRSKYEVFVINLLLYY